MTPAQCPYQCWWPLTPMSPEHWCPPLSVHWNTDDISALTMSVAQCYTDIAVHWHQYAVISWHHYISIHLYQCAPMSVYHCVTDIVSALISSVFQWALSGGHQCSGDIGVSGHRHWCEHCADVISAHWASLSVVSVISILKLHMPNFKL